ncbi:MAG: homoserine kinase [archaeon]
MAVKTTFSKEDFNKILSEYDLGEYKKFKPFKLGAVQTNLLLETTRGKFVFRYYENRPEKYALFESNILQYLKKHSYPCPAPIRNKHGRFLGKYKNKPFALFELMEGVHRKKGDAKLIAQTIGKLHKISIGYKPEYYKVRDTYDPNSCWKNAKLNSRKIKSKSESENRLRWLKIELQKLKLPNNLPKGLCHCDTHPSNFLYKNNKLTAVLDFDDASYVYLLYDISNMIYFWAWPHKKKLIFNKAKELLVEYNKHRKLTQIEKEHLYDILKMVVFMSIGWFIHDNDDYESEKKKIESLNLIGREEFYNKLFC